MANSQFAENFYAFRSVDGVIGTYLHPSSAHHAALLAIEAKLGEANKAYFGRRYRDAIDAYHEAASLLYAQIDPQFTLGPISTIFQLSRDPSLFDSMLSVGLEWKNILPVHQINAVARPRIPAAPAVLAKSAPLQNLGVNSTALRSAASVNATADWQLSQVYSTQGYTEPAKFFLDRARNT